MKPSLSIHLGAKKPNRRLFGSNSLAGWATASLLRVTTGPNSGHISCLGFGLGPEIF